MIRAVALDFASTVSEIGRGLREQFASEFLKPGSASARCHTDLGAMQEIDKVLGAGLQFISEARLGKPSEAFELAQLKRQKRTCRSDLGELPPFELDRTFFSRKWSFRNGK